MTSADGTTIAFGRSGAGPAVVLVHGAFTDRAHPTFAAVAAAITVVHGGQLRPPRPRRQSYWSSSRPDLALRAGAGLGVLCPARPAASGTAYLVIVMVPVPLLMVAQSATVRMTVNCLLPRAARFCRMVTGIAPRLLPAGIVTLPFATPT